MSSVDKIRTTFQDFNSNVGVNLVNTSPDTEDDDIVGLNLIFQTLTNSHVEVTRREFDVTTFDAGDGTNASYPTVDDMVTFLFQTSTGATCSITCPAPLAAIFEADDETVDEENADVQDLIAWILAFGKSADGTALAEYVRGWRWMMSALP